MSREEIIKMAREANARWEHGDWNMPSAVVFDNEKDLERFFHMAQAAEREACAKVCDERAMFQLAFDLAGQIRARGQA